MRRVICFGCIVLIPLWSGCSQDTKIGKSSEGTNKVGVAPDEADKTTEATKKLKVSLDSWTFGDSAENFKKNHPDIDFSDLGIRRSNVLLRYEINNSRSMEFKAEKATYQGVQFAVTLVFSGPGGKEIKEGRICNVHQVESGTWMVVGITR
jgi:hypothetical protein